MARSVRRSTISTALVAKYMGDGVLVYFGERGILSRHCRRDGTVLYLGHPPGRVPAHTVCVPTGYNPRLR